MTLFEGRFLSVIYAPMTSALRCGEIKHRSNCLHSTAVHREANFATRRHRDDVMLAMAAMMPIFVNSVQENERTNDCPLIQ